MARFTLWGVIASPYLLKMQALLDFAQQPWERWPEQGSRVSATALLLRLQGAKRRGEIQRFPAQPSALDEYPSVPFYTLDKRCFYYDSSALANHLDQHPESHEAPLIPAQPAQAFVCRLIDEAFDEFGLYMVHHMRWVGSARTTPMGTATGREMKSVLPFGASSLLARSLPRRQVKRCPYLFSVAPENYDAGVIPQLTPPSRPGFPQTHTLLDEAWCDFLAAMEQLLSTQPYLLGARFTLADASAYGQLSMNLIDGDATRRLEALAPRTYQWLCAIRDGEHIGTRGALALTPALQPLLDCIGTTFVPLMAQNAAAYEQAIAYGETLFNEAAFDCDRALYDGELRGHPFRAVAKSFQVQVWRDLKAQWQALASADREYLQAEFLPEADDYFL